MEPNHDLHHSSKICSQWTDMNISKKIVSFPTRFTNFNSMHDFLMCSSKCFFSTHNFSLISFSQNTSHVWLNRSVIRSFLWQHTIHFPWLFIQVFLCNEINHKYRTKRIWSIRFTETAKCTPTEECSSLYQIDMFLLANFYKKLTDIKKYTVS